MATLKKTRSRNSSGSSKKGPTKKRVSAWTSTLATERTERTGRTGAETWDVVDRRVVWRKNANLYLVERLGIPPEFLKWSIHPAYKKHAWDGTPDPLVAINDTLSGLRPDGIRWAAVEGATGTSKTFNAACLTLWFLECFDDSLVVTTAPKERQLELHLWKDLAGLYPIFREGKDCKLMKLRLDMQPTDEASEWQAIGFVAGVGAAEELATKAQGFHRENMLFILEETPGIDSAVIGSILNTSVSPNNLILALGNPDNRLDPLHKLSERSDVAAIRISGLDFPNVVRKDPLLIPGAQSQKGLDQMLVTYLDSSNPLYLSRARGISPAQSEHALIRLEWILAAMKKDPGIIQGTKAIGVDVANSQDGDHAAVAQGQGSFCLQIDSFPCPNANRLGDRIHVIASQEGIDPQMIGVDGVGVGASTVNHMRDLGDDITDIQSGAKAVDLYGDTPDDDKSEGSGTKRVETFANLRSQMWWTLRQDLQRGLIGLPMDSELQSDLITPKWTTRNGKIVVEAKEDIRKRLGRSPNKGDAVVYWNWIRTYRSGIGAVGGLAKKEVDEDTILIAGVPALIRKDDEVAVEVDVRSAYRGTRKRTW